MSIVFGNFQALNIVETVQSNGKVFTLTRIMGKILSRIISFGEKNGYSIGQMERVLGASKGVFSKATNGGTDVKTIWIEKFVEKFPQVSAEWLLRGEGESFPDVADHFPDAAKMIETGKEVTEEQPDNGLTAFLQQENARLHTRITELERQNAVLSYRLEQMQDDK